MKKISNLSKKFGSFIRELRIRNSIGQRALAKKIGIAASYLNDIEKNKNVSTKEPMNDDVRGATNHFFFLN